MRADPRAATSSGVSRRAAAIPGSVTFELDARVSALKAAGTDVIGLAAGQPDFPTPPEALAAAHRFLQGGRVTYTPTEGIPELRAAAAEHLSRVCDVAYAPGSVVVTCGAKEALFLAVAAVTDPGDEVLVPLPAWLSYEPMVSIADAVAVGVPTGDDGFKLTPEALASALTPRTRALVLNSPGNPTGSVYSRAELAALAEVVIEHDLLLISDEIYWCFVFEGQHVSPASLPGMLERTLVVNGVSKSHAMTGWRIGFLAAPPELARAAGNLKSHLTSNAAAPSQYAALGALEAGEAHTHSMRAAFRRRRDLAVAALARMPGVRLVPPSGAFYVFPRVDAFYGGAFSGSMALCSALLEKEQVAVVPGAAFGEDRCLRLSIATPDEVLQEGLARLGRFLARLPARRD